MGRPKNSSIATKSGKAKTVEPESPVDKFLKEKLEESAEDNTYKRMCMVTNWSQFRAGKGRFQFEYINLHLCNHIVFSSASVAEDNSNLEDEFKIQPIQHNDFGKLLFLNSGFNKLTLIFALSKICMPS